MSNPNVVQAIPLAQIRPNPNNPPLNQGEIDLMMASLKELGQETDAKVRPLTEEEKAADPDHLYELIGGHLRFAAAQRLGWPTLSCKVMDKDPAQAATSAFVDNRTRKRSWLEDDLDIGRIAKLNGSQRKTADELEISKSRVNDASQVFNALTPTSIALIRQNLAQVTPSDEAGARNSGTQNKPFLINEWMIRTLADLGDPQAVEKALLVVLDHHLTQPQIQQLVAWVQAGNPAEAFDPKAAKAGYKASVPKEATHTALAAKADPVVTSAVHTTKAAHAPKSVQATHADSPITGAKAHQESAQPNLAAHPDGSQQAMGSAETALFEAVAGMSVIAKIRSKIKKGQRPNLFEVCLLAVYNLWHGLVLLVKNSFRLTKQAVKWTFKAVKMTWKLLKESLEIVGLYKYIRAVFVLGMIATLLFGAWYVHKYGTRGLVHLVYSKIVPAPAATPVPTPHPIVQTVEAVPTVVTEMPTPVPDKVVTQTKMNPTPDAKGNMNGPLAQSNPAARPVNSQQTPTAKPQGDLLTQGTDAITKGAGLMKAFGF